MFSHSEVTFGDVITSAVFKVQTRVNVAFLYFHGVKILPKVTEATSAAKET